jgi:hypothetical protein
MGTAFVGGRTLNEDDWYPVDASIGYEGTPLLAAYVAKKSEQCSRFDNDC